MKQGRAKTVGHDARSIPTTRRRLTKQDLLEEIARLRAENARLKRDYQWLEEMSPPDWERAAFVEELYVAWANRGEVVAENAKLRAEVQLHRDKARGDYWIWQGDGTDEPESLACPVLMHPEDLRKLLAEQDGE